jgi:hypothetical protein
MLSYNQQYNIANGIFITYDSQLDYRLMHSKHKSGTRENMKSMFPYHKWEGRTKETFVLACLFVIFNKTPSSYRSFVDELREVDMKEIAKFKHIIMNNQDFIAKDIAYLREKYGSSIDPQKTLKEFVDGQIQFYTAWWYVKLFHEEWNPGRTFSHILRKLRFLMLFLTFKEESVQRIQEQFKQVEI